VHLHAGRLERRPQFAVERRDDRGLDAAAGTQPAQQVFEDQLRAPDVQVVREDQDPQRPVAVSVAGPREHGAAARDGASRILG
jgi:hypothetical protein